MGTRGVPSRETSGAPGWPVVAQEPQAGGFCFIFGRLGCNCTPNARKSPGRLFASDGPVALLALETVGALRLPQTAAEVHWMNRWPATRTGRDFLGLCWRAESPKVGGRLRTVEGSPEGGAPVAGRLLGGFPVDGRGRGNDLGVALPSLPAATSRRILAATSSVLILACRKASSSSGSILNTDSDPVLDADPAARSKGPSA